MKSILIKVLSFVLVIAITAGIAVTGTLAYLQSEDSDVNVMTLGNVTIAQHEYERALNDDGTYKTGTIDNQTSYILKDFTQAKPLVPIVGDPSLPGNDLGYAGYDDTTVRMSQVDSYGSMQVFAGKNAQDKFVTVENTGKSPAYVRTLVAIEVGTTDGSLIGTSYHKNWTKGEIVNATVNSKNYMVVEYIYAGAKQDDGTFLRHANGILPAGETTYPNLSQVYIKSVATNNDLAEIDGNGNGMLDIFVLSQAVQADGFANAQIALDTAFGEVDATNCSTWFSDSEFAPTLVATADELTAALTDGKDVVLTADVDLGATQITVPDDADVTINLNGKDLKGAHDSADHYSMFTIPNGAALTIEGEGDVSATTNCATDNRSLALFHNAGKLTINGGNYTLTDSTTGKTWIIATIVDNRTNGATCEAVLTINGGTFTLEGNAKNLFRNYPQQGGSATIIFNGGNFVGNVSAQTTYIWNQESGTNLGELYFNGGTYDSKIVYEDYNGQSDIHFANGVVVPAYSGNN